MTFIGLFYIKQHPQIDESMKCYGLGTKEKCEDTYINFLTTFTIARGTQTKVHLIGAKMAVTATTATRS